MLTNTKIEEIVGVPSRTLQHWKNADGYKKNLFYALKAMSEDELIAFIKKGGTLRNDLNT